MAYPRLKKAWKFIDEAYNGKKVLLPLYIIVLNLFSIVGMWPLFNTGVFVALGGPWTLFAMVTLAFLLPVISKAIYPIFYASDSLGIGKTLHDIIDDLLKAVNKDKNADLREKLKTLKVFLVEKEILSTPTLIKQKEAQIRALAKEIVEEIAIECAVNGQQRYFLNTESVCALANALEHRQSDDQTTSVVVSDISTLKKNLLENLPDIDDKQKLQVRHPWKVALNQLTLDTHAFLFTAGLLPLFALIFIMQGWTLFGIVPAVLGFSVAAILGISFAVVYSYKQNTRMLALQLELLQNGEININDEGTIERTEVRGENSYFLSITSDHSLGVRLFMVGYVMGWLGGFVASAFGMPAFLMAIAGAAATPVMVGAVIGVTLGLILALAYPALAKQWDRFVYWMSELKYMSWFKSMLPKRTEQHVPRQRHALDFTRHGISLYAFLFLVIGAVTFPISFEFSGEGMSLAQWLGAAITSGAAGPLIGFSIILGSVVLGHVLYNYVVRKQLEKYGIIGRPINLNHGREVVPDLRYESNWWYIRLLIAGYVLFASTPLLEAIGLSASLVAVQWIILIAPLIYVAWPHIIDLGKAIHYHCWAKRRGGERPTYEFVKPGMEMPHYLRFNFGIVSGGVLVKGLLGTGVGAATPLVALSTPVAMAIFFTVLALAMLSPSIYQVFNKKKSHVVYPRESMELAIATPDREENGRQAHHYYAHSHQLSLANGSESNTHSSDVSLSVLSSSSNNHAAPHGKQQRDNEVERLLHSGESDASTTYPASGAGRVSPFLLGTQPHSNDHDHTGHSHSHGAGHGHSH